MAKDRHYQFRDQDFWAENGLIYIMDYRDEVSDNERFAVATRANFVARAIALNDQARYEKYADERVELNNLILDMVQACKDAKKQGDPTDPEVARQKAWENRKMIILSNYDPSNRSKLIIPGVRNYKYESEPLKPLESFTPPEASAVTADSVPETT